MSRVTQHSEPSEQALGLAILQRLRQENVHASGVMAQVFRDNRVRSETKAAVASHIYGVVRSQRLLDHVIDRLATFPVQGRTRDRARWLLRTLLDGAITVPLARRQLPRLDWDRVREIERDVQAMTDATERLALLESLPDWLASRWIHVFGAEEAAALARASNQPAPQTIRVNTLQADRDTLAARLRDHGLEVTPTARASQGLIVESRTDLFRVPEFRLGLFEVQDEGSQLVSELVAPPPGGSVLDACAGTGGKTLHLGALLRGRGRLYAVGVGAAGRRQLVELRRRARRAGLHNVRFITLEESEATETPESTVPDALPPSAQRASGASPSPPQELAELVGRFDRVLVDAPCSGLGVLRRNPETRWRVQASDVVRLAALQRAILERFAPCVRPGGRLVYSTCSILPEENEDVAAGFRRDHPEFSPVDAKEILGSQRAHEIGDGHVLRLLPHRHGTDGFFAAVWRRTAARKSGQSP